MSRGFCARSPTTRVRGRRRAALIAAVGVIAALLLAPQSGRKTREQLRGYARKAENTLREAANEAGAKFEEALSEGKEYVEARKSVLREAFEAGREAMKRERERAD